MHQQSVSLVNIPEEIYTALSRDLLVASCNVISNSKSMNLEVQCEERNEVVPDVFLVGVNGVAETSLVHKLSTSFLSSVVVAVTPISNDPEILLQILRSGASKILQSPWNLEDLMLILQDIALHRRSTEHDTPVIGIASEQSGLGSTTLAVNLAYEFASTFEKNVVLIEIPNEFSTLPLYLGLESKWGLQDLIALEEGPDTMSIEKALVYYSDRLKVLSGSPKAQKLPQNSTGLISRIIRQCQSLFEVVVLDVSTRDRGTQSKLLRNAKHSLLVVNQSLPCLSIVSQCMADGSLDFPFRLVVNEYEQENLPMESIQRFLNVRITHAIRSDSLHIPKSIASGKPVRELFPTAQVAQDYERLAAELLGVEAEHGESVLHRVRDFFTGKPNKY